MSEFKKEISSGIFFICVSILYFIGTFSIPTYSAFGTFSFDSTVIPKILAILVFVMGLLQVFTNMRKRRSKIKGRQKPGANGEEEGLFAAAQTAEEDLNDSEKVNNVLIGFTILFLCIYVLLLDKIGFILMTSAYLIAQMLLLTKVGARKKKAVFIILLSIAFSVAVYFLFVKAFSLILPAGILG